MFAGMDHPSEQVFEGPLGSISSTFVRDSKVRSFFGEWGLPNNTHIFTNFNSQMQHDDVANFVKV